LAWSTGSTSFPPRSFTRSAYLRVIQA
jgi:hypothetical protein